LVLRRSINSGWPQRKNDVNFRAGHGSKGAVSTEQQRRGVMLNSIISDVLGIFRSVFMGGDMIALAIVVGAVIIAAMVMQRGSQIGSMTLLALALFAFGGFVRGVMRGPVATDGGSVASQTGGRAMSQINSSLSQFYDMSAGGLLAYFIAFMILILLIFGVKSALFRS